MLKVGMYYNLITKYPLTLGAQLNNLKLIGIIDFTSSTKVLDTITQHQDVVKESSSSDVINTLSYKDFLYHHFVNDENISFVIPLDYISTYSESGNTYTFKVSDISDLDRNVIKEIMLQNGYIIEEVV